jgi:hypothetical protein
MSFSDGFFMRNKLDKERRAFLESLRDKVQGVQIQVQEPQQVQEVNQVV